MKMDRNQSGLALGSLFGLMHLLWVLVVWAGMGQALADMMFSVHYFAGVHDISPVGAGVAVLGVVGAFLTGYVTAWVFAILWNLFGKR